MNWDNNGMVTFKEFFFAFTQPKIRRSESIEPAPQEASSSSLLSCLGSSSSCSICGELMVEITRFACHWFFLRVQRVGVLCSGAQTILWPTFLFLCLLMWLGSFSSVICEARVKRKIMWWEQSSWSWKKPGNVDSLYWDVYNVVWCGVKKNMWCGVVWPMIDSTTTDSLYWDVYNVVWCDPWLTD
jgi:hypothetical protein